MKEIFMSGIIRDDKGQLFGFIMINGSKLDWTVKCFDQNMTMWRF